MLVYVLKRLIGGIAALLVVSVLVFVATNLLPGDPAYAILGRDATPERVAELQVALNLDEPLVQRYLDWLQGIVQGDFGTSITQGVGSFTPEGAEGMNVSEVIAPAIANTAVLGAISLLLLVLASIVVGTVAAVRRGRVADTTIQVVTLVFIAIPEFVLGAVLIILFAFVWPVLPAVSLDVSAAGLVLPVATLVLGLLGLTARMVRVGVSEVLETNYVTAARLRGVPERRILRRHVLPNALGPTLQAFAIATGILVGGVVVVEYLFGYPGIGSGFVNAVAGRDYPVIQAYTLILAGSYILANIVADVLTVLVNPRRRAAVAA